MLDFPARALVRFFRNHGLLAYSGQHQWMTVRGGSVEYVRRLEHWLTNAGVDIRTSARVSGVRRIPWGVEVRTEGGEWEFFDEVVFAAHADDALALLADATQSERAALTAIRYQPNEAVLHCDASVMPNRRKAWASWVYTEGAGGADAPISLSYWMNSLQPIPADDPMFVTLNPGAAIREEAIYDQTTFRHPVFDLAAMRAQEAIRAMNGSHNTWFCGAWMRHGFHEDGFATALDVAAGIEARARERLAA
jgi:predicted NAD/FAD-binding protein